MDEDPPWHASSKGKEKVTDPVSPTHQKLKLFEREERGINVDLSALENVHSEFRYCLVGTVLSELPYNYRYFKTMVIDLWRHPNDLVIRDCRDNRYLFQFTNADEILDNEPWAFDRKLIVLAQVGGASPISDVVLNSVAFWIRVYHLPLLSICDRLGRLIGNQIGVCQEVDCDVNGDSLGDYFRIRVRFDVTQSLWRRMLIHFKDQKDRWVEFSYELLPDLCFKCGMVDHWTSDCNLRGVPSPGEGKPFGPWLKVEMDPFRRHRYGGWGMKGKILEIVHEV